MIKNKNITIPSIHPVFLLIVIIEKESIHNINVNTMVIILIKYSAKLTSKSWILEYDKILIPKQAYQIVDFTIEQMNNPLNIQALFLSKREYIFFNSFNTSCITFCIIYVDFRKDNISKPNYYEIYKKRCLMVFFETSYKIEIRNVYYLIFSMARYNSHSFSLYFCAKELSRHGIHEKEPATADTGHTAEDPGVHLPGRDAALHIREIHLSGVPYLAVRLLQLPGHPGGPGTETAGGGGNSPDRAVRMKIAIPGRN